ncbi:hypothetical protein ACFSCV_18860 [Methylopila henanensis]|uniref:Uncharacterized protein n=1 Tax=Methylopila henanensis TaxID=873516 RepID=A0ABW4KDL9_9HYPH
MTSRSTVLASAAFGLIALATPVAAEAAPRCDDRAGAVRHGARDGHDHAIGPEHRGHRHGQKTHNFKGYALKPRCAGPAPSARPTPGLTPSSRSDRS